MDWIDEFIAATEGIPSPQIFRRWGAISAVSASLERKVWLNTLSGKLFPNMYNILVGGPGSGKTFVTAVVRELLDNHRGAERKDFYMASSNVTKAAFTDELNYALRRVVLPDGIVSFNSLQIVSNELGTLISKYDNEFLNTLTDLYDNKGYSESKRSRGTRIEITDTCVGILAACTPAFLRNLLPEGAWEEGFLSRVILVYSGENILVDPFGDVVGGANPSLAKQLTAIYKLNGEFEVDAAAMDFIRKWHLDGGAPKPQHPKLEHYNARRIMHILKLCMVSAVSRLGAIAIEVVDAERALGWLLEAEHHMNDLFKAMRAGGDMELIREAEHFVARYYLKKKVGIPKHMLVAFVAERTPAQRVDYIIQIMCRAKLIQEAGHEARRVYKPGVR